MGSDLMIAGAAGVSTGKDEASRKSLEDAPLGVTCNLGKIKKDKVEGLINFLMKHRHGTPFEHGAITTYHHHPIFVEREAVRHRIGISINEESARYSVLKPVFYIPEITRPMLKVDDWQPGKPKFLPLTNSSIDSTKYSILSVGLRQSYEQDWTQAWQEIAYQ